MPQPLLGMELSEIRDVLGPPASAVSRQADLPSAVPAQSNRFGSDFHPSDKPTECVSGFSRSWFACTGKALRFHGRHQALPAPPSRRKNVETVLMPEEDRDTVCISSQVGCPVDCKFCMTALMGLERNLTAGEIVGPGAVCGAGKRPA